MVDLIPRQILFGNPERISPRLSPDGTKLAWLAPHDGVLNVWLAPASTDTGVDWDRAQVITHKADRAIEKFAWAYDNQHLLYLQDTAGDENWRLYDVDLPTMTHRDLTPFDGVQTQLIALEPDFPSELLLGMNQDRPELHDVYRLKLATGKLTKEITNPGVIGFIADSHLVVRAAFAPHDDGSLSLLAREVADGRWREVLKIPVDDALSANPITVSQDGRFLLMVSSVGADTARLVRIDLATGVQEVLAEDPDADVRRVRVDPATREPQIVTVLKDRSEYLVLDPEIAGDLEAVRALHPGDPWIESADDADGTWLVGFTNDSGPISYFAFDRASKQGRFLFEHRPALSAYTLAAMEPFSFTSRDGLTIHGYATFPPDGGRTDLPTVLNVHGGPWNRDTWDFDPETQWLANRGYLCLQVNFRGSTGYGKAFVNAGDREWGAKMQDDLTDAVAYAVKRRFTDASRIAIYGRSYGGYAALAGAAFTPEVYRCAVDMVGPSNLKTLVETIPPYWAPIVSQFHRRVGNPETDDEFLWSRSPLSRADEISIPVLIAQGANDPRVRRDESEQIVAALKTAGIEHEYLLFPDEGHGFVRPENRMQFYAAAERFLARYLGGRCED